MTARTSGRGKPLPYITTKYVRLCKRADVVIGPYKVERGVLMLVKKCTKTPLQNWSKR